MALGVPVLVRNIPGNSALIKHRETGLLFNTPEVCTLEMFDCCCIKKSCNNKSEGFVLQIGMRWQAFDNVQYSSDEILLLLLKEFVTLAKELKESPSLYHYITTNAKKYVCEHHSIEGEKKTYKGLLDKLAPH